MANIMEIIIRIIGGVISLAFVGSVISLAFVLCSISALVYMIYYFFKYGKNAFVNKFLAR